MSSALRRFQESRKREKRGLGAIENPQDFNPTNLFTKWKYKNGNLRVKMLDFASKHKIKHPVFLTVKKAEHYAKVGNLEKFTYTFGFCKEIKKDKKCGSNVVKYVFAEQIKEFKNEKLKAEFQALFDKEKAKMKEILHTKETPKKEETPQKKK